MKFKKQTPEVDGFYFACEDKTNTVWIVQRKTFSDVVCWYSFGCSYAINGTAERLWFGDRIEIPNIEKEEKLEESSKPKQLTKEDREKIFEFAMKRSDEILRGIK